MWYGIIFMKYLQIFYLNTVYIQNINYIKVSNDSTITDESKLNVGTHYFRR